MSRTWGWGGALAALALLSVPAAARPERGEPARRARPRGGAARDRKPELTLDGERRAVRWVDGDTFRVLDGPAAGKSARLIGYNSLESYGPVHRWGGWRPAELLALARAATRAAQEGRWHCTTGGGEDAYGRLLVSCPDAARALVGSGLAMVFAVDEGPDPGLVALQRSAQERGEGMWRKGAPPLIPSSLHSAGEPGLVGEPYDRIVDTRTGRTEVRRHPGAYRICQVVCVGAGADRACMTYVPFERRYRDRPGCLFRK